MKMANWNAVVIARFTTYTLESRKVKSDEQV